MDVDLSSMEMLITSPADEACATMQLQDLLCWLQVRLATTFLLNHQPPLVCSSAKAEVSGVPGWGSRAAPS